MLENLFRMIGEPIRFKHSNNEKKNIPISKQYLEWVTDKYCKIWKHGNLDQQARQIVNLLAHSSWQLLFYHRNKTEKGRNCQELKYHLDKNN